MAVRTSETSRQKKFPGIAFRDSTVGREAHVEGHRVAVWEVVRVHRETKTIAKTADYFRWPTALVRHALAYAKAFPAEMERQCLAETGQSERGRTARAGCRSVFKDLLQSVKEAAAIERGEMKPARVFKVEPPRPRRKGDRNLP